MNSSKESSLSLSPTLMPRDSRHLSSFTYGDDDRGGSDLLDLAQHP